MRWCVSLREEQVDIESIFYPHANRYMDSLRKIDDPTCASAGRYRDVTKRVVGARPARASAKVPHSAHLPPGTDRCPAISRLGYRKRWTYRRAASRPRSAPTPPIGHDHRLPLNLPAVVGQQNLKPRTSIPQGEILTTDTPGQ
jgi:hypothetical protein